LTGLKVTELTLTIQLCINNAAVMKHKCIRDTDTAGSHGLTSDFEVGVGFSVLSSGSVFPNIVISVQFFWIFSFCFKCWLAGGSESTQRTQRKSSV